MYETQFSAVSLCLQKCLFTGPYLERKDVCCATNRPEVSVRQIYSGRNRGVHDISDPDEANIHLGQNGAKGQDKGKTEMSRMSGIK